MNEQNVETAMKLYKCRTVARGILGDKYQEKMSELVKVISAVAKRDDCNAIIAGAKIVRDGELEGMQALMLMAAVVEMVEPSNK